MVEYKGIFPSIWANLTQFLSCVSTSNTSSPIHGVSKVLSVVDGLVGTFQMPRSQKNRVLPVQVLL